MPQWKIARHTDMFAGRLSTLHVWNAVPNNAAMQFERPFSPRQGASGQTAPDSAINRAVAPANEFFRRSEQNCAMRANTNAKDALFRRLDRPGADRCARVRTRMRFE
jgi:hypothetical protein